MIMPPEGNVAGKAEDTHEVPLLDKTLPEVLGATEVTAEVPLPINTAFEVMVVAPVPPLATGRVPETPLAKGITDTATNTKSSPFQATRAAVPATTVTPVVGPAPTILMLCVLEVLLITA
jgi:hypothetical protein